VDVGVVVAVRAPAPYLERALDSVLAERPAAVVVVDDGSDPSLAPDARVRWIRREVSGGPGAARNDAIAALETEWIAFCDADDEWEAGKLAAQARVDADVVCGSAEVVDAAGRPTGETWVPLEVARLYEHNPILLSSVVVRRELLVAAGGFDASLRHAEDWDLWLRLAQRGARFATATDARVRYRRHPGGLTHDVAALARAQLEVHRRHGGAVDAQVRRRVEHRDLLALAEGLVRERRWDEASAAIGEAAALGPVPWRLRPGVRRLRGRRDPYRR
jgi:glycosyltransferase involved in cell wall biosynthesis